MEGAPRMRSCLACSWGDHQVPAATHQAMGVLLAWGGMPGASPWRRAAAARQWGAWVRLLLALRWALAACALPGVSQSCREACPPWREERWQDVPTVWRADACSVASGRGAGGMAAGSGPSLWRGRGPCGVGVPAILRVTERSQGLLWRS